MSSGQASEPPARFAAVEDALFDPEFEIVRELAAVQFDEPGDLAIGLALTRRGDRIEQSGEDAGL